MNKKKFLLEKNENYERKCNELVIGVNYKWSVWMFLVN